MKKTFCLIFAAVLSLLPMTAISQNLTTEGPFCRQLVGSGIYAVRMSIEVTEDGYLRISLTRAYSENIQAKPSFDFDREWKILNPTSSLPAGMPVKPGIAGVNVSDLENGQSITITKDHELLRGAWTKNGYMTLLEIPYKIGANISTLTSNYLPSFPFDHDKMQCSSVSAIITSETDLLSLCVGSEVTLNAEGFDGNGNFVWERSDSPDGPWEEIPGQNASSIKIVSKNGNEYFKVSQNGTESEPFMLTSVPCCQYTDEERKLWSEDFGTVPKGTRECCDYVKNHICSSTTSTEIPDGQFAVVSNSDDALDLDGTIYKWARNKTDHTGNPDGGFLVVNIGQPVLFYEQEIERDFCEKQWYHLSIFACNISQSSGHQAAEFRFEVATTDGQVLAEGETGPLQDWEMENWTNYGISFNSGNYNKFIIRLYSVGGAVNGNDVAIDDMSISVCSPQINLYADIDAGLTDATVDCGSDLTLSITGSDEYLHSIYSNPYVLWQKSTDEGATWTNMEGSGIMVSEMTVTKDDPSVTDYYRAILAGSRELAEEAAATGTLASDCEVFSISNMVRVDCQRVCKVTLSASDETPCEGEEITLTASPGSFDSYDWTGPGVSGNGNTQTVVVNEETTYKVSANGPGCITEESSITIMPVKKPAGTELTATANEICSGETITLAATASNADEFELFANGTSISRQEENEWQISPLDGENTYKVIAYNQSCGGETDEVKITVHSPIEIGLQTESLTVCKGSEAELAATVIAGEPTRYFWNGEEGPNPHVFTADHDMTVEVFAENDYCTSETVKSNIYVKEAVKITMSEVNDICLGENINITATISGDYNEITWFESVNGSEFVQIPGKIENTLNITPQKSGITIYKINVSADECPNTSSTVELFVHEPIVIEVSPETATVCQGSEVELTASVIKGNPTLFFWNGTEAPNPYKFTANNDQTIEVYAKNDVCSSEPVTSVISVENPVAVSLPALDDICLGEDLSIAASVSGDFKEIQWFESIDGGDFVQIPGENGSSLDITPQQSGNTIYRIDVLADACPGASASADLLVNEPIIIKVQPENATVCKDSEVQLTASVIAGNPTSFFWNGAEASDTYTFTAGNDMTIEVFAENDFCKSGPVTASITVQKPVNVTLPELDDICFGDDINIAAEINGNYDDIVWTVSTNGNEFSTITGENGDRLSVTPLQTGKAEYGIEVSSRICGTASGFTTLNVNEVPEILQIADNAASEGFVSLVIGNGTPPYSVFLNGQSYGTNTNPGGLQPNTHYNVEISDANGCMAYGEFQTPGMPIDIPLFFSPNGDGINDAWKVDNLETYHGAAIEIYDRFGRKLCTLNADDDGWDGTYNGHDMPMDDYWYIISIPEENRRLSGHFTLKR